MTQVRWGALSTASIGSTVVSATRSSQLTCFTAVASCDGERARQFADIHGLDHGFGSYEALLESDRVDAVCIALPSAMHTEWTIKALNAGKHVLCEKPFALRAKDAARAFDAAAAAGRLCSEGFMYRHHPQTTLARRLVEEGAIGALKTVRAALAVSVPEGDIRRSRALGGGALLDLGCYCVSAARLFAGTPERFYAEAIRDGDGVDVRFSTTMRLPDGVLAQFDMGLDLPRRDELELIGTDGRIVIADPWLCRARTIELCRGGGSEHLPVDPEGRCAPEHEDDVYHIELDSVSESLANGAELPFGRTDAIDQARVIEALSESSERALPVRLST